MKQKTDVATESYSNYVIPQVSIDIFQLKYNAQFHHHQQQQQQQQQQLCLFSDNNDVFLILTPMTHCLNCYSRQKRHAWEEWYCSSIQLLNHRSGMQ